ncbi:glucan endo-1,3-beta-glucosidase 14-like [Andrographis paniculata]|uniref:glucan endo-1,3-beta-glucosidase 14-like n=1 Tax=Andrographis paniculata TaxID=175694 RepID=UPI0021E842AB|nr:glucan endo-1,3-beta-glucosidase 14-like [Andrographis paniculata]XP_051136357.1 glucan endo-1,3-beta-glucosidase 14-like [Andrographis paniculata]XP_051136358.1 glucan endo-1,3-beta-glucosidase 14-like [Andrographis paniculata]XP_051136360.1 glucan endo-1,3-beta-glucosidase 14-like [Andrographis paniculata]XP_051136361.1 glucan endo-1,3-beta-glucosidase 14-like [Andrographis paniculata]
MKWYSLLAAPEFDLSGFFPFSLWFVLLLHPFSNVALVHSFTGTYGVNYGRIADNIPPPESVVTLLKAAKIRNIRIYDADHAVLKAFKGSGIQVIVGLGNEYLRDISTNQDRAIGWVKENVQPFHPGTLITGVAVGNEILGGSDAELWEVLVPAVKNVYDALSRLHLNGTVEVSSPHSEAVFAATFPPSAGVFKESIMPYMRPLLQFFSQIGTPFYINAYPFLAYKSDPSHIDLNYALFQGNAGIDDPKTKLHYDNMFEAQIDAAYAALEKAGFDKMEVIVSETGWASKGDPGEAAANVKNAQTYNRNLRKRLLKKKGTPYRPKTVAKAYVFALFNENLKPGPTSERNFGLFKADGSVAYYVGFTGLVPSSGSSIAKVMEQGWLSVGVMAGAVVVLLHVFF